MIKKLILRQKSYDFVGTYYTQKVKTRQELTYENTIVWLKRAKFAEDNNFYLLIHICN